MNSRTRTAGAKSAPLLLPVVSTAAAVGEEQGARPGRAAFARTPAKFKGLVKRLATIAFMSAAVWWAGTWVRNSLAPELLSLGTSPPFGALSGAAGNGTLGQDEEQKQQYKRANTAILRPPVQAKYSGDGCAHALLMPKVALLFLTSGELFHEPTWKRWFASAEGLLPALYARETACEEAPQYWDAVQSYCSIKGLGSAIAKQHLFSVYVHAPPAFKGFFGDSLWSGHMIPERVKTAWGSSTLIEAARYLLFEAFKDPLNERFMLLSESDLPLLDPLTLYSQLVHENASRINACGGDHTSSWRWNPAMELPELKAWHWRKSSQFFTLNRQHAEVVLNDTAIFRSFEAHCNGGWNSTLNKYIDCYSDEHYFPTLLAAKGLENETACESWGPTAVDWSRGGASPRSYGPADVVPELIERARGSSETCNASAAHDAAQKLFIRKADLLGEPKGKAACLALKERDGLYYDAPLPPVCKVLARKFPNATVAAVSRLFSDCSHGLGLLADPELECAEALLM